MRAPNAGTSSALCAMLALLPALVPAGCGASVLRVEITDEQARQARLDATGGVAVGPDGAVYLATSSNVVRYDPYARKIEPLVVGRVADVRDVGVSDDGVVLVLRDREVSACLSGYLMQVVTLPGRGQALACSPEGFYVIVRSDDGVSRVLRYLYKRKHLEHVLASDDPLGALAATPGGCLVASVPNVYSVTDPAPSAPGAEGSEVRMKLVCGVSSTVRSVAADARSGLLSFSDGAMTWALSGGEVLPLLPVGGRLALRNNTLTVCHTSPTQVLQLTGASGKVGEILKQKAR
jgi:hypothetical protein